MQGETNSSPRQAPHKVRHPTSDHNPTNASTSTAPMPLKNPSSSHTPSFRVASAYTPSGKVKPHQPRLNGMPWCTCLRVISAAVSNHQKPQPHSTIPATSPSPRAVSPKPCKPLAAKIAGASPPSSNIPSAPVPIGPSASQLDAAICAGGSLCRAMRRIRMVRILNATGNDTAHST